MKLTFTDTYTRIDPNGTIHQWKRELAIDGSAWDVSTALDNLYTKNLLPDHSRPLLASISPRPSSSLLPYLPNSTERRSQSFFLLDDDRGYL